MIIFLSFFIRKLRCLKARCGFFRRKTTRWENEIHCVIVEITTRRVRVRMNELKLRKSANLNLMRFRWKNDKIIAELNRTSLARCVNHLCRLSVFNWYQAEIGIWNSLHPRKCSVVVSHLLIRAENFQLSFQHQFASAYLPGDITFQLYNKLSRLEPISEPSQNAKAR